MTQDFLQALEEIEEAQTQALLHMIDQEEEQTKPFLHALEESEATAPLNIMDDQRAGEQKLNT